MPRYRDQLPQLSDKLFLTDGGLETTLIFDQGFDLPEFAAFTLLRDERGRSAMEEYFQTYADISDDSLSFDGCCLGDLVIGVIFPVT